MANRSPTLRSTWLGQQIREMRESAGMQLKEAAEHLERDVSSVSRYESGETPLRRVDLLALLDLYGIHDPDQRDHVLALRDEAWRSGWWDGWQDLVTRRAFVDYAWLESRSQRISVWHPAIVPGLLQTRAYAEALIRHDDPSASEDDVRRFADLRQQRQATWREDRSRELSLVLEESVLSRPVGGPTTLFEQLERLLDATADTRTEVRILPTRVGAHAGLDGPFTCCEPTAPYPTVVYLETLSGGVFVEDRSQVDKYTAAYDELLRDCLDQDASRAGIQQAMEEVRPS